MPAERVSIAEIRAGRDIYDLSHHLGHSSVNVTEIYLGYVPGYSRPRETVRGGAYRREARIGSNYRPHEQLRVVTQEVTQAPEPVTQKPLPE